MSDFTRSFFVDPEITIKEEPIREDSTIMNTSASVPIPTRRVMEISDYRDFGIDLENSQSPLYQDSSLGNMQTPDGFDNSTMWSNRLILGEESIKTEAFIHMDDDDIFQVDKADLIQGPTLAELNANDDTLLGDLNFDDLLLPEEGSYLHMTQKMSAPYVIHNSNHLNNNSPVVTASSSCPQPSMLFYRELDVSSSVPSNNFDVFNPKTPVSAFSPTSQTSSNSPQLQSSPLRVSSVQQKHSTLHELLMKKENYISPDRGVSGQTIPAKHPPSSTSPNVRMQRSHISRLSSSAPTHVGFADIWQRREPRKHLLSTGSLAEAGSTSSISTGGILSPDPQDFSHDEFDTDEESDGDHHYEDVSSEIDSDDDEHVPKQSSNSKKERFFWQYNVQAKGPKGQRLVMKCKMEDPHVLNEITDPVFSPDCSVRGIKHSGKARKGDGNDLTPNARKLFNIGKELDKLGRTINDMTPVSELPFNVRPKSRKEKNKLASRACRLKKKAQHEANKIKLNGLEAEHRNLLNGIGHCRDLLLAKLQEQSSDKQEELTSRLDNAMKAATRVKVAGGTTDYVNKILERLKKGQPLTGVDEN